MINAGRTAVRNVRVIEAAFHCTTDLLRPHSGRHETAALCFEAKPSECRWVYRGLPQATQATRLNAAREHHDSKTLSSVFS